MQNLGSISGIFFLRGMPRPVARSGFRGVLFGLYAYFLGKKLTFLHAFWVKVDFFEWSPQFEGHVPWENMIENYAFRDNMI